MDTELNPPVVRLIAVVTKVFSRELAGTPYRNSDPGVPPQLELQTVWLLCDPHPCMNRNRMSMNMPLEIGRSEVTFVVSSRCCNRCNFELASAHLGWTAFER